MLYITKQYKFCAAHRYWNDSWSNEKNYEIFGNDIKIHGHNYTLDITISGSINDKSGFIVDMMDLNKVVHDNVIKVMDHSQIEQDIEWFKDKQPSTENMVIFIWDRISDKIPSNAMLHSIKLRETSTIYTTYFGPNN